MMAPALTIRGAVLRAIGTGGPYAESRPLSIEQLQLDAPRGPELLIEIEAASLCHSDLSVIDGKRPRPVPILLGHEAAGKVIQIGDEVDDIAVGQRVVLTFLPRCGECDACSSHGRLPCVPGSTANGRGELLGGGSRLHSGDSQVKHHLGVSGFATHAVVDRRSVVAVDDDVPAEIAAVVGCAVITGGGALLNTAAATAADRVIVVGLGGVGMAAVLTAVAIGCREVIAIDSQPAKRDKAIELGATAAAAPDEAIEQGIRGDIVIEAVGRAVAFETAFALTAPGGTLVTVGIPAADDLATISPLRLTGEAITIAGSYMGSAEPARDVPRLLDLWRAGRLPLERLISHRIELDQINEGMDRLVDATALRQVISFAGGSE